MTMYNFNTPQLLQLIETALYKRTRRILVTVIRMQVLGMGGGVVLHMGRC